ncbi:hypothetical protein D6C83_05628 [Aureobasidium pullulans]|uniref:REJ domain-containing protein n=1 Tax=Aureobasidium pullulans TaxID=5580 RepID=A0A4T0CDU0_AURPU|nr:hypothetical protein D6C83_05628 [Aureobasidium pullulans]
MRTYTTLLTFSVAMLFVSQVLASPALEARQNSSNATASTSSSSSSTSSSSAASDTESGTPAGVGTGSSGSGEGSSGQNTVSDASLRYGVPGGVSGAVGLGVVLLTL